MWVVLIFSKIWKQRLGRLSLIVSEWIRTGGIFLCPLIFDGMEILSSILISRIKYAIKNVTFYNNLIIFVFKTLFLKKILHQHHNRKMKHLWQNLMQFQLKN